MSDHHAVRLLLSREHECGYLPHHSARSAFIDPSLPLNPDLYGSLLTQGFRRSGDYVYRPLCRGCEACRPVRVPVARFRPDRSQRRATQTNAGLQLHLRQRLTDEHYRLYQDYLRARHDQGGMDPDDVGAFHDFLEARWSDTDFWEFRENGRLLILAVVDHVPDGLSAVYTCFDPTQRQRGLGTYAIVRQIEETLATGLNYLYLGYWVAESEKMDYKRHFKPLEILTPTGWAEFR